MADEERPEAEPSTTPEASLAPPKLGRLLRGRGRQDAPAEPVAEPAATVPAAEPIIVAPLEAPLSELIEPAVVQEDPTVLLLPESAATTTPVSTPTGALFTEATTAEPEGESGPPIPGQLAAMLGGLIAGLVIVGLTALTLRVFTAVHGTDSWAGPGLLMLIVIVTIAVTAGSRMMRLARIEDSTATSVIGVGLTAVIALLVLVNHLTDWWMVIAIPLITVATFLVSHALTANFSDVDLSS